MKGKKQPFPPRGTPVSHEIVAKLWKDSFWNCFNTTIRVTKCLLNLFKSSRISCGCETVKVCQRSLINAWKVIWKNYLVERLKLTDSVQPFVLFSAHFLTSIYFLLIATCFDFITVGELFLPISSCLLIVSSRLYFFTSRFFSFLLV